FLPVSWARNVYKRQVELSDDGQLLLVERFDLDANGQRLGFEDVASLMGLRVRDTLSERKYHGSYQRVAELLGIITKNRRDLQRFYEQLAFSIMVGNGDAHLKNFGVLYRGVADGIRLAPMFDVVTTRIYRYQRSPGGPEQEDRTMALRLWSGKARRSKAYPLPEELLRFGREVCGLRDPLEPLDRIAQAMRDTLSVAPSDPRIPASTLAQMRPVWEDGLGYAR
ncbi:MAG: HipA domain-containing protein, partial [Bryobacterales bacterium]|nr:HipA domain-containing protein [Bryobacterales bacterium]